MKTIEETMERIEGFLRKKNGTVMTGVDIDTGEFVIRVDYKDIESTTVMYTLDEIIEDSSHELHIFREDMLIFIYRQYKISQIKKHKEHLEREERFEKIEFELREKYPDLSYEDLRRATFNALVLEDAGR